MVSLKDKESLSGQSGITLALKRVASHRGVSLRFETMNSEMNTDLENPERHLAHMGRYTLWILGPKKNYSFAFSVVRCFGIV